MTLDVTNIFETNDIRKLFISLITSGIEKDRGLILKVLLKYMYIKKMLVNIIISIVIYT